MSLPDPAALLDAAQTLGVPLTARQAAQLLDYLGLLGKWNRVFNLTSIRDPAAMSTHHLLDCLAIVAPVRRQCVSTVVDVGSGAGLPGVVLAIVAPELKVTCIDAVAKKAAFVKQVAGELGLDSLVSLHSRIEAATGPYDVITSRAFASLRDFIVLTQHLAHPDSVWLAMKGRYPAGEVAELPPGITAFHVEQLHVPGLNAERCIVWLKANDTTS